MRVLVTGATGFVGGHVVDRLLARGDTVTALVRSPERAAAMAARGVHLVAGDLGNHEALAAATDGQEVILHSAALTGAVDEAEFLAANRDGTANLARAARRNGATPRFVLVSSMAAGGPAARGAPRRADGHDAPVTMYGRSKLSSEQVLRDEPLPWVILRPPTVYGPRDTENLLGVFKAARLGIAPVFGDGSMEISVVHVEDLADAIVLAGSVDEVIGRTYYVNHPELLTSREFVHSIGAALSRKLTLLPIPEWLARTALTATGAWAAALRRKTILRADKANEFFQAAWTGDPTPFIDDTGWAPRFDAASGLVHTHDWYRDAGWL